MPKPDVKKGGTATAKKFDHNKKEWTLSDTDLARLKKYAGEGDELCVEILDKYTRFKTLSDKQYDLIVGKMDDIEKAPALKNHAGERVRVLNWRLVDLKPTSSCIEKGCRNTSVAAIPSTSGKAWVGVCQEHAEATDRV